MSLGICDRKGIGSPQDSSTKLANAHRTAFSKKWGGAQFLRRRSNKLLANLKDAHMINDPRLGQTIDILANVRKCPLDKYCRTP